MIELQILPTSALKLSAEQGYQNDGLHINMRMNPDLDPKNKSKEKYVMCCLVLDNRSFDWYYQCLFFILQYKLVKKRINKMSVFLRKGNYRLLKSVLLFQERF